MVDTVISTVENQKLSRLGKWLRPLPDPRADRLSAFGRDAVSSRSVGRRLCELPAA